MAALLGSHYHTTDNLVPSVHDVLEADKQVIVHRNIALSNIIVSHTSS